MGDNMKSGFVSIVGRPNVGKSTLLNNILERKVAITSSKAQTTRNIIQGIYTTNEVQIVFIDTPGIHKPMNKLGNILNKEAYTMIQDVDLVLFIVDVEKGIGKGDKFILENLKNEKKDVILLLNKIDRIKKENLLGIIDECKDLYDFKEIVPISALKGDNVKHLIDTIIPYLKDDVKYYEDDIVTNVSKNFMIAELIREKVLRYTDKEVPHAVTCMVENIEEEDNIVNINAVIIVDRDSLKKIIIGKNGQMLKQIGTKARIDIENLLGKKVYLEIFVKTIKSWREKEKYLIELGLKNE
ncbi:MAG: GTPase Era [Bacilli bacterium]